MIAKLPSEYPRWSDLPLDKAHPKHSAWFQWGEDDELGTLNHLTPEAIRAARDEIKSGQRVSLNWSLDLPAYAYLNRSSFCQRIINKAPRVINDDEITFNTQQSSQWDSFKHYAYQDEKRFYNNVQLDEVYGDNATLRNGIHVFADAGIVGRGVLLDFYGWAQRTGRSYDPFTSYAITFDQLEECRVAQGVTLLPGDIVLIRSGHIAAYKTASDERHREIAVVPHAFAGIDTDKRFLEWIWDNKLAAVAGDAPAWEVMPPTKDWGHLHPYILSGLGCPIGELFDLEALAKLCESEKRYTFFLTSACLNIPGGVASPPNALAIM